MVSLWCRGGVPVVSRRCNGLVSVVSRWCPNGVPVVFRVSVVSLCHIAGAVVSRWCLSGVPVVSRGVPVVLQCVQWCPGGVPVVGAPVVSRWCPGGWCSTAVSKVSQCCFSGVLVVSRASWVLVFHPVVSRSCGGVPVPTTISENLRLRGGWCSAGEVVGGVAVGWCRSVIRSVF